MTSNTSKIIPYFPMFSLTIIVGITYVSLLLNTQQAGFNISSETGNPTD